MNSIAERVNSEVLPFVVKPGRLLGCELGSICHPYGDRVNIALTFPDIYDLGMSNVGFQILYQVINQHPLGRAERAFAATDDLAGVLKAKSIPLFSLESKAPLRDFDLIGFNSAYELCYTNILHILDLAGVPLLAAERTDHDPLVAVGGTCAFNPEPLADFVDFFFLGDGEEAIAEIIEVLHGTKGAGRAENLRRLNAIEGVYVPSCYSAEFDSDGRFRGLKKVHTQAPDRVRARVVKELKSEYYPRKPLVPFVETVHDRLSVEIMRGCGHACRFCQATVIYRPLRVRRPDEIVAQVEANLAHSGFDDVTLLSLSSADYKEIVPLCRRLMDKLKPKRVALSLPSLRVSSLSLELAELITSHQKTGLTFALEAGTERLRKVINKPVDEETLLNVIRAAFKQGWTSIKLYFMIGLPTETDEDLRGIADLVRKLVQISDEIRGSRNFNLTISTFVPKAHTPWQWEEQISPDEIKRRRAFLRKSITAKNVHLKFHEAEPTILEGILARGDRRLGKVILGAYRRGARMDSWSETFKWDLWQQAFAAEGIDPQAQLAARSTAAPLPWDHIDKGLEKDFLARELARSRGLLERKRTEDELVREAPETPKPAEAAPEAEVSYGRAPRTVKAPSTVTLPQSRLRVRWGREGPVRFLSHLDNMRALERAIRRAGLPVSYSQGYTPRPKLSFGPPLPLGYTSEAEYLDIQLELPPQQYQIDALSRAFPPGFRMIASKPAFAKSTSLSSQLNLAVYQVDLALARQLLEERTQAVLSREEFRFLRETKSGPIEVEARKAILGLEVSEIDPEHCRLTIRAGMADLGFIRPNEILEHGLGLDHDAVLALPIHRQAMFQFRNGTDLDPFTVL